MVSSCGAAHSATLCCVGNGNQRLFPCIRRIASHAGRNRQDADEHDGHRDGRCYLADRPGRFAAVSLVFLAWAQMPALQLFEGLDIGRAMLSAALVRGGMQTH